MLRGERVGRREGTQGTASVSRHFAPVVDPRLTLPASTAPGNALASVQPLAAIATLRPGSTLVATVLARLGDTRALLALGSRTVEVRTTT
ncbi:MAG: hypothetical protein AAFX85_04620, partial [Pseudomonadota bacterium]